LDNEALTVEAMKQGAQDYLIKGEVDARRLLRPLRYAIERKTMEEALFMEKERALATLNCIGDAVACMDISGQILTPQSGRGRDGRPVATEVAGPCLRFSVHPERHQACNHPECDEDGGWRKPNLASAVELYPHPV